MHMKNSNKICLCIIIGFAVLGIAGSSSLFFINIPTEIVTTISVWVGIVGTAASVVLSVLAMIYSNKSSKDAEDSLKKVTEHYETLSKALASQEIQTALGKSGVESMIKKIELCKGKK